MGGGPEGAGEALITLAEAASLIWCSQRTIERWIEGEMLTCYRDPKTGKRRVSAREVMLVERFQRRSGRSRLHTRGGGLAHLPRLS